MENRAPARFSRFVSDFYKFERTHPALTWMSCESMDIIGKPGKPDKYCVFDHVQSKNMDNFVDSIHLCLLCYDEAGQLGSCYVFESVQVPTHAIYMVFL